MHFDHIFLLWLLYRKLYMQKCNLKGKCKIMKIVFIEPWKPLELSGKIYLLIRLSLHIGLPSHPVVTADSNTLRELCPFLYKNLKRGTWNRFNVPHLPYRFYNGFFVNNSIPFFIILVLTPLYWPSIILQLSSEQWLIDPIFLFWPFHYSDYCKPLS